MLSLSAGHTRINLGFCRDTRSKATPPTNLMKPLKEPKLSLFPLVFLERYGFILTLRLDPLGLILVLTAWCKFS